MRISAKIGRADQPQRSQWNGWGRDLDNSRYQPKPGIKPEDVPRLKVKWAWTHPGRWLPASRRSSATAFSSPPKWASYLALNAQTGCTYWTITRAPACAQLQVSAPFRLALGQNSLSIFGDQKSNVAAVDAASGEFALEDESRGAFHVRITGSPVLYRTRLYVPVFFR